MTGSTPHLCDEIGMLLLNNAGRRQAGNITIAFDDGVPTYDAPVVVKAMGERVVLSAKWNQRGTLLLLNTRPYARARTSSTSSAASSQGTPTQGNVSSNTVLPSFEDLLSRPAPDLSTSME